MEMTNRISLPIAVCLLLAINSFSQNEKRNKENTLVKNRPVYLDLIVNGHLDSIQFAVMTELVNRKFKIIDRTTLDRMSTEELMRRTRTSNNINDLNSYRPSNQGYFQNQSRPIAQRLGIEFFMVEDSATRKVDSVKWVISPVPPNPAQPPVIQTLHAPSNVDEVLAIIYDRIAPVKKKEK
jgi:hypothetical protein